MHWRSAVSFAVSRIFSPITATASILMPALVEPMLTEEQICSVRESASGMLSMRARSPGAKPFCTRAEYPPMKLTPTAAAARSRAKANFTGESFGQAPESMAMGVTEMRLWMMGMPYCRSISSQVGTSLPAYFVIFRYMFSHARSMSGSIQSRREMPMVTVRMSRCSSWIMVMVSRISCTLIIMALQSYER